MLSIELMSKLLALLRGNALPTTYSLVRWPNSRAYHIGPIHFTQLSSTRRRNSKRRRRENAAMPKAPKSKKKGNKFYAVRVGRTPGVYQSWDECEMQVRSLLSEELS
jgi:hypothetical protein